LVIGEFGFSANYGKEDMGLHTNLKFGAYFNGGTFEAFDAGLGGGPLPRPRRARMPSTSWAYEMTLELTYGCVVMLGLLLQPDLQYIINPGGNRAIPNALAIGVNAVVNF
jgi:hypothetical protein